jgi:hypothetical protein
MTVGDAAVLAVMPFFNRYPSRHLRFALGHRHQQTQPPPQTLSHTIGRSYEYLHGRTSISKTISVGLDIE